MTVAAALTSRYTPLVYNSFTVPGSDVRFSAACFEGKDWSLAPLQEGVDAMRNIPFANRLSQALGNIGATCAFAPNPTQFNGKIIDPSKLSIFISLGNRVYLRRNKQAPADGTFLRHPKEAGIFSAGGCGVIVMSVGKDLVFAHAGRDCLLDRHWVKTEGSERTPGREYISVIDSMINALGISMHQLPIVHVWPLYFIKPEDFAHQADDTDKDHAEYNRAAIRFLPCKYGRECGDVTSERILMDLPRIARMQCIQYGIPIGNIHMEHAYLADELPTTRNGGGRYLVGVVRNS